MTVSLMSLDNFAPFADGLDHPEGVTWGPDGYVYAGGELGQVYRVNLEDGSFEVIGGTGGFALGVCPDADCNIYVCDLGKRAVMRVTQEGEVSVYSEGSPDHRFVAPNYAVFDRMGNLYVSDCGGWNESNGCILRVSPGGETELVSEQNLGFANGMALSPDGTELYVVLSAPIPSIGKVRLHADGQVSPVEQVVELPLTVPDGVAFDVQGNLYVSCYTPDRIYRLTPAGQLDILAEDWRSATFSSPTNIAFCGSDLTTLVVSSLARWHLTKGQMPIPGSPLAYPEL